MGADVVDQENAAEVGPDKPGQQNVVEQGCAKTDVQARQAQPQQQVQQQQSDPNAVVQTGEGVPDWRFSRVSLHPWQPI